MNTIIHADAETHTDEPKALCKAEASDDAAFIGFFEFGDYECREGETKCERCTEKVKWQE